MSELKAGARVEVADYKNNPADFVLWKPAGDGPGWDSPWGLGRPGWHIECSAMSAQYLGQHFDIHGGGVDLIFPHHENEIAQSTCAHGNTVMANWWVHNGLLTVDGKKMSKSLGNFTTVRQAMVSANGRGDALRLLLLSGHYRHELDFTQTRIDESIQTMNGFWDLVEQYGVLEHDDSERLSSRVLDALLDDLNSPMAIAELHSLAKSLRNSFSPDIYNEFSFSLKLLGFMRAEKPALVTEEFIQDIILKRQIAKASRDFGMADYLRSDLAKLGVMLEDTQEGTKWRRI
jgi:cysteinyl-tRNA synthetase